MQLKSFLPEACMGALGNIQKGKNSRKFCILKLADKQLTIMYQISRYIKVCSTDELNICQKSVNTNKIK